MDTVAVSTAPRTGWKHIKTLRFLIGVAVVGFALIYFQKGLSVPTAGFLALASAASGAVIGFLFGIPRVLQRDEIAPAAAAPSQPPAEARSSRGHGGEHGYRLQVNTNLEQISDWLTKIIVGLGLIEMRRIPGALQSIAEYVTPRESSGDASAMAMSLIVSFAIVGFFVGYLMTRLYLSQAFREADIAATVSVAGRELTVQQLSAQIRAVVADLQDHVLDIRERLGGALPQRETLTERVKETGGLRAGSILWVDDNPANNSVMIERLSKLGIRVVTSLSTADALAKLRRQHFDRIITDLGRQEGPVYNPTAGIDLIREVRTFDNVTPIVVHCSVEAAAKYKYQAIEAGATEVTPSQTVLLQALHLDEGAPAPANVGGPRA